MWPVEYMMQIPQPVKQMGIAISMIFPIRRTVWNGPIKKSFTV